MKKFFVALFALVMLPSFAGAEVLKPDAGWELEKDKKGVKVYLKQEEGRKIKSFWAETTIDAPLEKVVKALQDIEDMPNWMPNCKETKLLEQPSETEIVFYMVLDLPMVADRDYVQRTNGVLQDDGSIKMTAKAIEYDAKPPVDGKVRITDAEFLTMLTPVEGGTKTVIQQIGYTDPGSNMPAWIINGQLTGTPYKMMRNLHELVGS